MNTFEKLNEKYHLMSKVNNTMYYSPYIAYIYQYISNCLNEKLIQRGYALIYGEFPLFNQEEKYFLNQEIKENNTLVEKKIIHASFQDEIKGAKTEMIDLLELVADFSKKILHKYPIVGKDISSNSESYTLGVYLASIGFVPFCKVQYLGQLNDYYHLEMEITSSILDILVQEENFLLPFSFFDYPIIIVPIKPLEKGINKACLALQEKLHELSYSSKIVPINEIDYYFDLSYPFIIEIGPLDLKKNAYEVIDALSKEKALVSQENLIDYLNNQKEKIDKSIYQNSLKNYLANKKKANTLDEASQALNTLQNTSFPWCGDKACLNKLPNQTSYLIPFNQQIFNSQCLICGKKSKFVIEGVTLGLKK
jgi:hypothetical protein